MNNRRPVILLTNDDGIRSQGLIAAAEQLCTLGELWVVAPFVQQTSAGRSFPPAAGGRIREASGFPAGVRAFSVEGSPAQCVNHALLQIMPERPDVAVSGVNSGVNAGVDITRSGTIGAALEAANAGVKSIAVSLEIHQDEVFAEEPQADFSAAAGFARRFAEAALEQEWPEDVDVLKIEVPDSADTATPYEVVRLSKRTYYSVVSGEHKRCSKTGAVSNRLSWRIETDMSVFDEGTDVHTVFVKRHVAVTPLSLDMTSRVPLSRLPFLPNQ